MAPMNSEVSQSFFLLAGVFLGVAAVAYFLGCFNGAVIVSKYILHNDIRNHGKYWAGLFCLLGHMFPCMFHFKGGKGILSGGTIALMLDWRVALVVWGGFLILAVLTKWVSLGSIWAGASFPFATWFVYHDLFLLILSIIIGGLIVWKHRGNLKRILSGTESKFSLHKKKEGTQ